jgi:hypothetical protein
MDIGIIKLKIKCFNKFENIINSHDDKIQLYLQYFKEYESKLSNLNNKNIFNIIRCYLQKYANNITVIINNINFENKEMFEDFISF